MELKQFRNKYDLELIPASHEGIINGTLVWNPLVGKPVFDHGGMPNHIFNAFLDADQISMEDFTQYLGECASIELIQANLAETAIDVDMNLTTTLGYPQIGKIGSSINMASIKKFTFGDLKVRTMSNLLRVRIDSYLEDLKKDKWDEYDGKIRKVFMITELYYGSIKLVTDLELKEELKAAINNTDLDLSNALDLGKSVEYTFAHQNVPFAMRLEKVKQFNG